MDRTSSSGWVRRLADMFAAQGLNAPALLAAAGIDAARLHDAHARFGADDVTRLWELALAASRNPDLGIDRELAARHIDFDAVGYATLSSADLRSALAELARYLALISSATTFQLQPEGADCWLVLGHTGFRRPLPPQRSGYSLLALLTLCRWISRREVRPLKARFGFGCPGNPEVWNRAFGCTVLFGAADHALLLAGADIDAPLPLRNADLLALHEQVLDRELAALEDERVAPRVTAEIARRLPHGEPRRQDVAASLGMTDRTLQRRLQAEHTTFQQLLDDARRELAARYLADPRYALGEVAHLLGFADPSNFFRACRRWFGQPPGHWRERHQRAA